MGKYPCQPLSLECCKHYRGVIVVPGIRNSVCKNTFSFQSPQGTLRGSSHIIYKAVVPSYNLNSGFQESKVEMDYYNTKLESLFLNSILFLFIFKSFWAMHPNRFQ